MSITQIIDFNVLGDERGHLIAIEGNKNIPFEIKRVYYLTKTNPGVSRGFHAHKELEQIAICVSGQCLMVLDNGKHKEEVLLDSPNKGVYIGKMIWREMYDFSTDCVLLVLANKYYDQSDYIRSYTQFIERVRNAKK